MKLTLSPLEEKLFERLRGIPVIDDHPIYLPRVGSRCTVVSFTCAWKDRRMPIARPVLVLIVCAIACATVAQDTVVTARPIGFDDRLAFALDDGTISGMWHGGFAAADSMTFGGSGGHVVVKLGYGPSAAVLDQCRRGCGLFGLAIVSDDVWSDGSDELVLSLSPTSKVTMDTCTTCFPNPGSYHQNCLANVPLWAAQYRLPLYSGGTATVRVYDESLWDCVSLQCSPSGCSPSMSGWEVLPQDSGTRAVEFYLSWCDLDLSRSFSFNGVRFAWNVGYIDVDGGPSTDLAWVRGDPWTQGLPPTDNWGEIQFALDTVGVDSGPGIARAAAPRLGLSVDVRDYDLNGRRIAVSSAGGRSGVRVRDTDGHSARQVFLSWR